MKNKQNNEYTESSNFLFKDVSESGLSDILYDSIDSLLKKNVFEIAKNNHATKVTFIVNLGGDTDTTGCGYWWVGGDLLRCREYFLRMD